MATAGEEATLRVVLRDAKGKPCSAGAHLPRLVLAPLRVRVDAATGRLFPSFRAPRHRLSGSRQLGRLLGASSRPSRARLLGRIAAGGAVLPGTRAEARWMAYTKDRAYGAVEELPPGGGSAAQMERDQPRLERRRTVGRGDDQQPLHIASQEGFDEL